MRPGRFAVVVGLFAAMGILAVLAAFGAPTPNAITTSTNACSSCHSGAYMMYVRIDSVSAPTSIGADASTVSVAFSVTGNEGSKPSTSQSFYTSDMTVTASSQSGLLTVTGSPQSYTSIKPEYSQTAQFTVTGKASGSDNVLFTVKLRPQHNSGSTTRTVSAKAPVQVVVNVPPVLSAGGVSPATGDVGATFTFSVTYKDANGDVPSVITLNLDGNAHAMAPADGAADTVTSGEVYSVALAGPVIGEGSSHTFSFAASDGKAPATGDTGPRSGPTVTVDRPPVVAITYPTGGTMGGPITVTGTASDPDPGGLVDRVDVTVGATAVQVAMGTTSWDLPVDLSTFPDGTLTIKAVAWSNGLSSAEAKVDITVSNTVVNHPPVVFIEALNGSAIGPVAWLNGTVHHPDATQGAPRVLVGVDAAPSLEANVTQAPDGWHWSIMLDLTKVPEGPVRVEAVAQDPYASSPVDARTLVLTPPGSDPRIVLDPLADPLWGSVNLTGTAIDPDGTVMTLSYSIDGGAAVPLEVVLGNWSARVDLGNLSEGAHTLGLTGGDGRIDVSVNATFNVQLPFGAPRVDSLDPVGPVEVSFGNDSTFRVLYTDGDSRGSTVAWALDGLPRDGSAVAGGSELTLTFDAPGNHTVTVRVSNTARSDLFVEHTWDVSVVGTNVTPPPPPPPALPKLSILAVGPTQVDAVVGDVVILQFDVVEGDARTIRWTVDGYPAGNEAYLAYMPAKAGPHAVGVTVDDQYGNVARLVFRVQATVPPAPPPAASTGATGGLGISAVGAATIGIISTLFVVTLAWAVGRTMEVKGKGAKRSAAKKDAKAWDAKDDGGKSKAGGTPRPPRASEGDIAPDKTVPKIAAPSKAVPKTATPNTVAPNKAAPRKAAPTSPKAKGPSVAIPVDPIPMERPCIVCGGRTQFYVDRGAYWCRSCRKFHPVDEKADMQVEWSEGSAS